MPRCDDTDQLLLAWARWHARQGATGCSSLALVIERARVGAASGSGTVRRRVPVETERGTRYEQHDVWQGPQRDTRNTSRSAPPIGVEALPDVLKVQDALGRVASTGERAAVLMDAIRIHYLAAHVPLERRLAALGIGEAMYRRRIAEGRRLLGVVMVITDAEVRVGRLLREERAGD